MYYNYWHCSRLLYAKLTKNPWPISGLQAQREQMTSDDSLARSRGSEENRLLWKEAK